MKNKLRLLLVIAGICIGQYSLHAQDAKAIVRQTFKNFAPVLDYSCKASFNFDIPGLNIDHIDGTIFYKRPNKFRVRSNGIVFLPKQNPNQILNIIADTLTFLPVWISKQIVNNTSCDIIQLVPLKDMDIVAAKLSIDAKGFVQQAQITSKENGTANVINTFDATSKYAMPVKSVISFDMKKFKVPKMVAVDINSKSSTVKKDSGKTTGSVSILFSAYQFNQKIADSVFTTKD
jgi:outer membrane lipoprotein-sorting protein